MMRRTAGALLGALTTAVLALTPAESEACTPPPPAPDDRGVCMAAHVYPSTTTVPANSPTILYEASVNRSGAPTGTPLVALLAPDGGPVAVDHFTWGGVSVIQATDPVEVGSGYRLQLEERCVDGGWLLDGGPIIEYPVEVVADLAAPTAVGELRPGTPASETAIRRTPRLESDCTTSTLEERVARVRLYFTPDPSLAPWLSRTIFEARLNGQNLELTGAGAISAGGREFIVEGRCDVPSEVGERVFSLSPRVIDLPEAAALKVETTINLECTDPPAFGCSAGAGPGVVACVIGLAFALLRRRGGS